MKKRVLIPLITIIIVLAACAGCYYMTMPVQGESEEVEFKINNGDGARTVIKNLKKANLIKNEYFTLVYYKINNTSKHPISFKAGDYYLNKADSLRDIIDTLNDSTAAVDKDSVVVRFPDTGRLEDFAKVIATKYNLEVTDVITRMDSAELVNQMIQKYPIVTEYVLNPQIRHPLEGYLAGDTYYFKKDATVEEIVDKLVGTTNDRMIQIFTDNNYTGVNYHDVLALASIVTHEGPMKPSDKDKLAEYEREMQGIAQVFLNRMAIKMTLGSDVTTYYAANKKIGDTLYVADFNICDGYNTRGNCVPALPVGPISSCTYDSIEAVIKGLVSPLEEFNGYYYFVADKNTKIYFSKSDADQQKVIKELKSKGLWLD